MQCHNNRSTELITMLPMPGDLNETNLIKFYFNPSVKKYAKKPSSSTYFLT